MVTEMTLSDLMARDGRLSSSGSDSSSSSSVSDSSSSSSSDSSESEDEEKPVEKVRVKVSLSQAKEIKAQAAAAAATAATGAKNSRPTAQKAGSKASRGKPSAPKASTAKPKAPSRPRGGEKTTPRSNKAPAPPPPPPVIEAIYTLDVAKKTPVVKKATNTTIQLVKGDPGAKCRKIGQECRGRRELDLVDPTNSADAQNELDEELLDGSIFNVKDDRGDVLRNLDMFYFCDEEGSPISLDIFELPREQRPLIMGFGTVIQPLPPIELPAPIRYYMPEITPSSKRKRSKSRKASRGKRKPARQSLDSSSDGSGSESDSKGEKRQKNGSTLLQVDGCGDNDYSDYNMEASTHIFSTRIYTYIKKKSLKRGLSQMDGASDDGNDSSSSESDNSSSDDSNSSVNSGSSAIKPSNPTSDMDSNSRGADSDSNDSSDSKPIGTMKKRVSANATSSYCKVHASTPKVVGADLDDLMRADGMQSVAIEGDDEELDLLECGFRYPEKCSRQRIWLPEISDWCLDYSDGDPTLWVITKHAWYKIAGPISGMLPHWSYRPHFTKPRLMFEACFHIAFVLREWLPKNPGLSYRATLQQVIEQSILGRYPLTTKFMIENYKFIASQLGSLGEEYGGNWLESAFFKQLQRMNDSYIIRIAKAEKSKSESEARRLIREREVIERRQKAEDERIKKEEIRKQRENERLEKKKYPMEDLEVLLELPEEERSRRPIDPSTPFQSVDISGNLLGELLMAYQTLISHQTLIIDCPRVDFPQLLSGMSGNTENSVVIGDVFMALLRTILTSSFDSKVFNEESTLYGVQERPLLEKLNVFTWPEVLRQIMCPDERSIGPFDPLIGCELVHKLISGQSTAVAFLQPVDVTGLGLADYYEIVKIPMDLSTVDSKLRSGAYEDDENLFIEDMRLIWSNAIRYNGEESEIGRIAHALSEMCENEYQRLVVNSKERIERRKLLCDQNPTNLDLHHALFMYDFSELPIEYRISALVWATNELLSVASIRAEIERNAELEFEIMREFRKDEKEVELLRRNADKTRREREDEFRQMCVNQGIPTNYNNVFSDATKKKHEFIAEFYTNISNERLAEEATYAAEKKSKEKLLDERLRALNVRFEPLGKDRYHVRYWFFQPGWLFREEEGSFSVYTELEQVESLKAWLNPKGQREFELKNRLESVYELIVAHLPSVSKVATYDTNVSIASVVGLPIDTMEAFNVEVKTSVHNAVKHALCTLNDYVCENGCVKQSFPERAQWLQKVRSSQETKDLIPLVLTLEYFLFTNLNDDLICANWKRKRRSWVRNTDCCRTFTQVVYLIVFLLQECFVVDSFVDYVVQLDRKEWFKLRPKPVRNFCPEVDQHVIYFGDGHAQAMKVDKKNKKPVKCDAPFVGVTVACKATNVSYHHGSGDPYALLTLVPYTDDSLIRPPGSFICSPPSTIQRLGRILARIVGKLRADPDSGPFLEPVSKVDFPTYTDIVLHPMDLSKIARKVKNDEYNTVEAFVQDVKLMADNCALFCEGRFPTLPPMARQLVSLCESLVKKYGAEIKSALGNVEEQRAQSAKSGQDSQIPSKMVILIRLENRLPEFIVDSQRYEAAISRPWKSGDKVRVLFRDPQGMPTEYFGGVAAGSLPFDRNGFLPWEALRVTWDEDDGSDSNRVNPWEAELVSKK
ncbi:hypothetical protein LEN26_005713 [Aphanomyces euteiches]|nr:hypothetical protein LEN26_005713 [Aphanomyces euteiches]